MSPATAKMLLHIFKWAGISTGIGILGIGPPASWVGLALSGSGHPWVVFVIAYAIYSIVGFAVFVCYLGDRARERQRASKGFISYLRDN